MFTATNCSEIDKHARYHVYWMGKNTDILQKYAKKLLKGYILYSLHFITVVMIRATYSTDIKLSMET